MTIHLPYVGAGSTTGGLEREGQVADFLRLMAADPEQRRRSVVVHPVVAMVAQARAEDMARRDYFGHVTPEGIGPNRHMREAGYALPDWYPAGPADNSIESIGGGFSSAADFWASLKRSPGHRAHVLGLFPMFAEQVYVGIGWSYLPSSTYRPIWAVLTCPAVRGG